jgi:RNA polymerase sigma-70 factor (ECF subfamily)
MANPSAGLALTGRRRFYKKPRGTREDDKNLSPGTPDAAPAMSLDPAELQAVRPYLLRFARLQLRDEALAEDAVSETLLAALEHPERFAGQSALRTWLVGILKHKIVDLLRSGKREVRLALASGDDGEPQSEQDAFDVLFTRNGHYQHPPSDWGDPDRTFERREFFEVLQTCVDRLPAKAARIFMMREWLELETEEICQAMQISATNAWVMLYRARMRLRECLEVKWFGNRGADTTTASAAPSR